MANADRIVWVDMEMSGLDPHKERILEIAALVTDGDLEIVATGPSIVVHQPEEVLRAMDHWNKTHHKASGLTKRVRESTVSEAAAAAEVLAFLKEHVPQGEAPLAGNSIHQDRRFLLSYMPNLLGYLHYRNIDVSTVKALVARWYPEEYAKRPQKSSNHRAMDDILESVAELRYYREVAFRAATGASGAVG